MSCEKRTPFGSSAEGSVTPVAESASRIDQSLPATYLAPTVTRVWFAPWDVGPSERDSDTPPLVSIDGARVQGRPRPPAKGRLSPGPAGSLPQRFIDGVEQQPSKCEQNHCVSIRIDDTRNSLTKPQGNKKPIHRAGAGGGRHRTPAACNMHQALVRRDHGLLGRAIRARQHTLQTRSVSSRVPSC